MATQALRADGAEMPIRVVLMPTREIGPCVQIDPFMGLEERAHSFAKPFRIPGLFVNLIPGSVHWKMPREDAHVMLASGIDKRSEIAEGCVVEDHSFGCRALGEPLSNIHPVLLEREILPAPFAGMKGIVLLRGECASQAPRDHLDGKRRVEASEHFLGRDLPTLQARILDQIGVEAEHERLDLARIDRFADHQVDLGRVRAVHGEVVETRDVEIRWVQIRRIRWARQEVLEMVRDIPMRQEMLRGLFEAPEPNGLPPSPEPEIVAPVVHSRDQAEREQNERQDADKKAGRFSRPLPCAARRCRSDARHRARRLGSRPRSRPRSHSRETAISGRSAYRARRPG